MSSAMPSPQVWDLWIPDAGATGVSFARGRLDPTDVLLAHAGPMKLTVEVRDDAGARLAFGRDLPRTDDTPILRLRREGDRVVREDIWPTEAEVGMPVLLPGGEVGILTAWWNAADHGEWRWSVELYNRR